MSRRVPLKEKLFENKWNDELVQPFSSRRASKPFERKQNREWKKMFRRETSSASVKMAHYFVVSLSISNLFPIAPLQFEKVILKGKP